MGSSTALRLACTTRSATVGIPRRRRLLVPGLGIDTCRTSTGANSPDFSESRIWPRKRLHPDPGLDPGHRGLIDSRSPCPGVGGHPLPSVHQERRVVDEVEQVTEPAGGIISRPTVQLDLHPPYREVGRTSGSGHATAPVFTGASSDIAILSLTDTLPPFPMCTGFPRLGVLRRLRPTRAFGRRRAYPCPSSWQEDEPGTDTDGSHVHCCSVDGLGTRLYPCGIATATP